MTSGPHQIEVMRFQEAWRGLRTVWNEILATQCTGIHDLDVTASFEWMLTLWETHLHGEDVHVLVLREGSDVAGILPLYRGRKSVCGVPCRGLASPSEIYAGRTGFLLRDVTSSRVGALVSHMCAQIGGWDVFTVTLQSGSLQEKLFLEMAAANRLRTGVLEEAHSPYILLQESWEEHFASLPKKLRSTMRNGEKRLRERGVLDYVECRSPGDAKYFNAAVAEIEHDSWKETAGTSIAANPVHEAFHLAITVRAAENGFFSGHLLLLDQRPIAYVMGMFYHGVFLDLKESYRNAFREMSPGHVLKNFLFATLYGHNGRVFDFMGNCEEYKMKWTDKTYSRTTYLLFNNTMRAAAIRWLSVIRRARWVPSSCHEQFNRAPCSESDWESSPNGKQL